MFSVIHMIIMPEVFCKDLSTKRAGFLTANHSIEMHTMCELQRQYVMFNLFSNNLYILLIIVGISCLHKPDIMSA